MEDENSLLGSQIDHLSQGDIESGKGFQIPCARPKRAGFVEQDVQSNWPPGMCGKALIS
jgi:hypothetical protein